MSKISPKMSKNEFLALAKKKMRSCMPQTEQYLDTYNPADPSKNYFYFSALWHIADELVTPQIVRNLQDGASMLSVGVGDGHLERLLVLGFNVPRKNIHIADKILDNPVKEFGFFSYKFDMIQRWPKLRSHYDYITFPESLGVALLNKESSFPLAMQQQSTHRFYEYVENTVKKVLSNEQVSRSEGSLYLALIENDVLRAKWTYGVIAEAAKFLSKEGEIRISRGGGIKNEQQFTYAVLKSAKILSSVPCYGQGPSVFKKLK